MNLYVFENREEALDLEPVSLTRPAFELRCGAFTFLERILHLVPEAQVGVFVRDELAEITNERFRNLEVNGESVAEALWLNGTGMWRRELIMRMEASRNTLFYDGERLIGARLDERHGKDWLARGGPVSGSPDDSLARMELSVDTVHYLWECVDLNGNAILGDSQSFDLGVQAGIIDNGVHLLNSENIHIGEGSRVKGGAVLDAEDGPIILGDGVTVLPNAYLQGPLVVGSGSLIKAGARIYGDTTIGPGCKVGGEIAKSIFQSWSNKQHEGFIGHAYIGEWVNLGADTNNSDLKNTYSPISVTVNGSVIDTGSLFVGLFMGDHSKTGINVMFNTGTSVGPASNIVGHGYPPKAISPFSWSVDGKLRTHQFDKFVQTARVVKKRRGQSFSSYEKQLYRHLFEDRSPSGSS